MEKHIFNVQKTKIVNWLRWSTTPGLKINSRLLFRIVF